VDFDEFSDVCFLMGKGKLAPLKGMTVPRLELYNAVLATDLAESVSVQLNIPLPTMKFYTDNRVVLGHMNNCTRRFHTYVSNRVYRILRISSAEQLNFITSEKNSADSRCVTSVINFMKLQ
jgi:arginine deiminase